MVLIASDHKSKTRSRSELLEAMRIDPKKLPQHVAIIMDGNGRWAKKRNQPRVMGHRKGADTVRMVIRTCAELGIPYLTLYAFSQENWKRPKAEVDFLMNLLDHFLDAELEELRKEGVQFQTIGHTEALPKKIQDKILKMKEKTAHNKRLVLTVGLNYGARQEILDAIKRYYKDALEGEAAEKLETLDEKKFSTYLDTQGIPDPDLLVRTSGEMRLSNFLLWQCSYSEIHISQKLWPDFSKEDFIRAIEDFGGRERRFGAIG